MRIGKYIKKLFTASHRIAEVVVLETPFGNWLYVKRGGDFKMKFISEPDKVITFKGLGSDMPLPFKADNVLNKRIVKRNRCYLESVQ